MSVAVCPCSLVAKKNLSTSLQQQNIKFWYTLLLVFTIIKMGKNFKCLQNPIQCQYQNTQAIMIQLQTYVIKKNHQRLWDSQLG